ncbi:hypothetical protein pgond44_14583 [Psychroflexus gondwanensis ACAM 44]|uniref:Chloroplast import component protein (Tic20) n=1 Tax=Psychroflexus gondwanensis ACAM 44 TaxID=1189619 RepID=N1WLQ6_9FLAO|nr:hypothetical protein [Psychroflexus gondwanensis]EMY79905.1 hypothetical protein pgond44_14583 [Psychroflexus gondwanensis ACAM 44]
MENKENITDHTISSNSSVNKEAKNIAIISYITIVGLIIAFVMNSDKKHEFSSYHIHQSLGLGLTSLAIGFIGIIPIIGWIINILGVFVLLYMWIMGLVNATNEKQKPIPIFGKKYEEWFKNV